MREYTETARSQDHWAVENTEDNHQRDGLNKKQNAGREDSGCEEILREGGRADKKHHKI